MCICCWWRRGCKSKSYLRQQLNQQSTPFGPFFCLPQVLFLAAGYACADRIRNRYLAFAVALNLSLVTFIIGASIAFLLARSVLPPSCTRKFFKHFAILEGDEEGAANAVLFRTRCWGSLLGMPDVGRVRELVSRDKYISSIETRIFFLLKHRRVFPVTADGTAVSVTLVMRYDCLRCFV